MVVSLLFRLVALLFLLRFVLQATQADFYNPISQVVIKGSDPLAKPLRALLPNLGRCDLASLILAWATGVIFIALISQGALPITSMLGLGLVTTLSVLVDFYWWTLLFVIVMSFISPGNSHPVLSLADQMINPLLDPIRKILPTAGPLDFSPLVFILLLSILQNLLQGLVR